MTSRFLNMCSLKVNVPLKINEIEIFVLIVLCFYTQDKCDMRPQAAHPLNNLTKASVKKPLSPGKDTFDRRIKHQGSK